MCTQTLLWTCTLEWLQLSAVEGNHICSSPSSPKEDMFPPLSPNPVPEKKMFTPCASLVPFSTSIQRPWVQG